MVYRKRKNYVYCRITLDLMKTRMDKLDEVIHFATKSDHSSYAFADISYFFVLNYLLVHSSVFLTLLMISVTCRILYLFLVSLLIYESVWFWELQYFLLFSVISSNFVDIFLNSFIHFWFLFYIFLFLLSSVNF